MAGMGMGGPIGGSETFVESIDVPDNGDHLSLWVHSCLIFIII